MAKARHACVATLLVLLVATGGLAQGEEQGKQSDEAIRKQTIGQWRNESQSQDVVLDTRFSLFANGHFFHKWIFSAGELSGNFRMVQTGEWSVIDGEVVMRHKTKKINTLPEEDTDHIKRLKFVSNEEGQTLQYIDPEGKVEAVYHRVRP